MEQRSSFWDFQKGPFVCMKLNPLEFMDKWAPQRIIKDVIVNDFR